MQTKFGIGEEVYIKSENTIGEVFGIQISKDKEKYSVKVNNECFVYGKVKLVSKEKLYNQVIDEVSNEIKFSKPYESVVMVHKDKLAKAIINLLTKESDK